MKRWIHDPNEPQDEFDRQWKEKFGDDDETMKFNSLEELHDWLEEVKRFEPVYDKSV